MVDFIITITTVGENIGNGLKCLQKPITSIKLISAVLFLADGVFVIY